MGEPTAPEDDTPHPSASPGGAASDGGAPDSVAPRGDGSEIDAAQAGALDGALDGGGPGGGASSDHVAHTDGPNGGRSAGVAPSASLPGAGPDGGGPDGGGPDGGGPDGSGPDGGGPDGGGPDGSGPDGSGPDGSGPDGSGPDGSGPDGAASAGGFPEAGAAAGAVAPVSPGGSAEPVAFGQSNVDSDGAASSPYYHDDETELIGPGAVEDETMRLTPDDLARPGDTPGGTVIMPTDAPAWSGRAGVPLPPGRLREPAPYQVGEPQPQRTWWTPILLGLLALALVGIVLIAAILINKDQQPAPQPTPTPTPVPQPSQTPAPTTAAPTETAASPSVQLVQVPGDIIGKSQDDATAELDAIGLNYTFEFQPSAQPSGTVIKTSPEPGKPVAVGSVVKLLISLGGQSPTPTPSSTP